jgi:hypothetical protein
MICVCVCILVICPIQILSTMKKIESSIIQLLNSHVIRSSLSMHMYYREHTQLECRNALMWGLKTHSPVDVVPVDDTQQRRTICTGQDFPLPDHMLHNLDQQFLDQTPILWEQEVLNPQLPSTHQCTNQSVLCTTHLITITAYVQSIFHRK